MHWSNWLFSLFIRLSLAVYYVSPFPWAVWNLLGLSRDYGGKNQHTVHMLEEINQLDQENTFCSEA